MQCIAGESPIVHSPFLGDVDASPEFELTFPAGLPGFESCHRFVAVEIPAQRPLVYLQSVDNSGVCFVGLPVFVINPEFHLNLSDEERGVLVLTDADPRIGEDVLCLALLMPAAETVETNLSTPVVVNLHNGIGVQCVTPGVSEMFRLHFADGANPKNRWAKVC